MAAAKTLAAVAAFVTVQVSIPYIIRKAVDTAMGKPGSLSLDVISIPSLT